MLSSPRRPSRTIRIFSSAENRRRVFRRISWTTFSGVMAVLPSLRIGILLPSLGSVSYFSALGGLTDFDAKQSPRNRAVLSDADQAEAIKIGTRPEAASQLSC